MTIETLQNWINRDLPRNKIDVELAFGTVGGYNEYKFHVYTENNKYTIYANDENDQGYLGCVSQSRKYRPGENWFRGNDLPDGQLNEETWDNILKAIVRYELKDIVKKVCPHLDE